MEQKDYINKVAGLLGFNRVYNRANNAHIVELIEEQLEWCLLHVASSKSMTSNKGVQVLTLSKPDKVIVDTENGYYELYEYYLPSDYLGYSSDNGKIREIIGDKIYSDVRPTEKLMLSYKKKIELRDLPISMFQYFCLELAIMVAPVIGEDKRLPTLEEQRRRMLEAGMLGSRPSRNNNVFGNGNLIRGRRRG